MVRFDVSVSGLGDLYKDMGNASVNIRREMKSATNDSLRTFQSTARIKIGSLSLREGIQVQPAKDEPNGVVGSVGAEKPIYLWHDQGTGIYGPRKRYIVPVRKKILAWHKGGATWKSVSKAGGQGGSANGWIFAMRVRGMKPKYFMKQAVDMNREWVKNRFDQIPKRVFGGLK